MRSGASPTTRHLYGELLHVFLLPSDKVIYPQGKAERHDSYPAEQNAFVATPDRVLPPLLELQCYVLSVFLLCHSYSCIY